jgi:hypothetical protein
VEFSSPEGTIYSSRMREHPVWILTLFFFKPRRGDTTTFIVELQLFSYKELMARIKIPKNYLT